MHIGHWRVRPLFASSWRGHTTAAFSPKLGYPCPTTRRLSPAGVPRPGPESTVTQLQLSLIKVRRQKMRWTPLLREILRRLPDKKTGECWQTVRCGHSPCPARVWPTRTDHDNLQNGSEIVSNGQARRPNRVVFWLAPEHRRFTCALCVGQRSSKANLAGEESTK